MFKKLVLSAILIFCLYPLFAQFTNDGPGASNTKTLFRYKGGLTSDSGYVNLTYATLAGADANNQLKYYNGATVFIEADSSLYVRLNGRWIKQARGSGFGSGISSIDSLIITMNVVCFWKNGVDSCYDLSKFIDSASVRGDSSNYDFFAKGNLRFSLPTLRTVFLVTGNGSVQNIGKDTVLLTIGGVTGDGVLNPGIITLVDSTVTVYPQVIFRRNDSIFIIPTSSSFVINSASAGYHRTDIIYIGTDNLLHHLVGTESLSISVPPSLSPGEFQLYAIDVYGNIITNPVTPGGSFWSRTADVPISDTLFGTLNNRGVLTKIGNADRALYPRQGGFLLFGITGAAMNAMVSPPTGTIVYVTDSLAYCYYNGSSWVKFGSGGGGGSPQTWQQTLIVGPNLTQDNTVDGGRHSFMINNNSYVQLQSENSTAPGQYSTLALTFDNGGDLSNRSELIFKDLDFLSSLHLDIGGALFLSNNVVNNPKWIKIPSATYHVGVPDTQYVALKVNGNLADSTGNIIISSGGSGGRFTTNGFGIFADSSSSLYTIKLDTTKIWKTDGNYATYGNFLGTKNLSRLNLKTNDSVRINIDSIGGNVGIGGLADPLYKLRVKRVNGIGSLYIEGDSPSGVALWLNNGTAIRGDAASGGSMYIDADRSVGGASSSINLRAATITASAAMTVGTTFYAGASINTAVGQGGYLLSNLSLFNLKNDSTVLRINDNSIVNNVGYRGTHHQINSGSSPITWTFDNSALLELKSTTSGFLMPRVTGAQMNAIAAPATGLLVYCTDSVSICQYTGSAWRMFSVGASNGVVKQTHTSGTTISLNNATTWLNVDPASILASLSITLPASPTDGQDVLVTFGGTITSGGVVTSISFSPTPIDSSTPGYVMAGEHIGYRWNATNSKWYRTN